MSMLSALAGLSPLEGGALPFLPRRQFMHCAVLIPLVRVSGDEHVLFEKRALSIRQGGEICFPGGRIEESDSSPAAAAVRETAEELGVEESRIRVHVGLGTLVSNFGALVDAYVGEIDGPGVETLALNRDEVDGIFTVPLTELVAMTPETYQVRVEVQPGFRDADGREITLLPAAELGLPERYRAPWEGRRSRVLVYRMAGCTVWGVTAELVHELVQRLRQSGFQSVP